MNDTLFTVIQALQLVALGPCLFIIFFLVLTAKDFRKSIIPALFFLSLSCSFLLPLTPLFKINVKGSFYVSLLFIESLTPALSFLLIIQFLSSSMPRWSYWLILALPVLGGSSFIYGAVYLDEVCIRGAHCVSPESLKVLYFVISSAVLFLLLVMHFSLKGIEISKEDITRHHRYWLVVALIGLSLALLANDLVWTSEYTSSDRHDMIATVIRIGFIYLVLTSMFRIFDHTVDIDVERIPTFSSRGRKPVNDEEIVDKLMKAVTEDKIYRELAITRDTVASRLKISEQLLSRVINQRFQKNFNEFLNYYRVEEAKQKLTFEKELPITNIAFDVGFNSIASFNRVFKDMTGQSPTEYRETSTR
ncbi:MAG: helix-turn-helix domain-containing protein [Rickettsiales bacterium]